MSKRSPPASRLLCVDFGSTYTKAALVDVRTGTLVATAAHPTTTGTDLMAALDAIRRDLATETGDEPTWDVRACSSAGGGLRIAVVGNEELVTSEAGRRVALSSGGRVVHVTSGAMTAQAVEKLRAVGADVILLVGGTDGGNGRVLVGNAGSLAAARLGLPVVAAGNAACAEQVTDVLAGADIPYIVAGNVLPEIGELRPESARAAIRETFVRHVIGGKHLSRREEFGRIVRGATPDLVLAGVEVLGRTYAPDGVVVLDIGGATTDVHSRVEVDPEDAGPRREVVGSLALSRTVEGDLGLRWNATGVISAAAEAGLLTAGVGPAAGASTVPGSAAPLPDLGPAVARRVADPGFLATTAAELRADELLASYAVTLALRRHAGAARVVATPAGRVVEQTGKDLRRVALVVGSGGLLRHGGTSLARRVLEAGLADPQAGGWMLPDRPKLALDASYVLAAVGLLAEDHPEAAARLAGHVVAA